MNKAVIYSRYSPRPTPEECKSVEKQIMYCRKMCEAKDWDVIAVKEDKAKSGGSIDGRDGLREALDTVCRQKAVLVVYSLSRLARNVKDAIEITERIRDAKAGFVCLDASIDTTTPIGKFFFHIIAAFAQFERETISQRTKDAMLAYQESGRRMSNRPPYGMKVDPDDKTKLTEDEKEVANIKRIIQLRHSGLGLRQICRKLEGEGRKPRSKFWRHPLIRAVLNRAGVE